jgi:3-hydroxy-9,10-secoandrosta-1,3,5(10)-triene-9,17-dione monooxygenase reductase component
MSAPSTLTGRRQFNSREFRDALGHYASGITTITGMAGDEPIGLTCQSFYSVSLEPALVSFSVAKTSSTYPRLRETGRFCVNLLCADQVGLSNQFARSGADKWHGVNWRPSAAGNPVLDDCLTWLDCEIANEIEAGDHLIVIGRVLEIGESATPRHAAPLLYFRGQYRALTSEAIA